ncbi:hypothetical protein DGMP_12550 [Desulfomarina profundi]|uniref:O-GlcNAc transferase C-terminal domain-containing protein n=2 Tax=Desulfomarina profundi TaxID=2772557 RepID=A0A8D5JLH0_9BACT|nr:hypothetical protein DGMP_12550 [Desulfomarina profundi]
MKEQFATRGITPERLKIGFHTPPWDLMRQIDIGLDCFPHNSGTTLFETLYMGIPFITLAGRPATGRLGCTILTGLGHTEWIASTRENYVQLAINLASDIHKLATIRTKLRSRMEKSSLMDEKGFARRMEKAYREMFEKKCREQKKKTTTGKLTGRKKNKKNKKQKSGKVHGRPGQVPTIEQDRLIKMYQQGNMVEAERTARSLLKLYPDDAQTWKILGAVRRQLGDFNEALTAMKRSVTFSPRDYICLRNIAVILCDLGKYQEAEKYCRKALKINPHYPDAFNTLGSALRSQKRYQEAEKAFRKAMKLAPDTADACINLALVLNETGSYEEAEKLYGRALKAHPDSAECYCGLSLTLLSLGRLEEAETECRRALELNPEYPAALNSLGTILHEQQRLDEAEICYRKAIQFKPGYIEALHNLGKTLSSLNRTGEAIPCFQQIVQQNPEHPEAWFNLGNCFADRGDNSKALIHYEKGLVNRSDDKKLWLNHGNTCKKQGLLTKAENSYRMALQLDSNYKKALNNLGNILQEQARFDESETVFRTVLKKYPNSQDAFGNLLFLLNYHPDKSAEEIFEEYRLFDDKFGLPLTPASQVYRNSRNPNRRLKIGYVCPQFCKHPVLNFLEPLLASHNRRNVELYGYSDVLREDEVTDRYRTYMDHWIDTAEMSDRQMATEILADKIDILVDLAGHTERNRLAVFATKPAPVSIHWLDFGYTTGLSAIDYYLADTIVVPEGCEHLFAETPWRLDRPSFSYRPSPGMGDVNDLPAKRNGYITFGCLSRAVRINYKTIRTWSEILRQVKDSKLILNSGSFADPEMQENMASQFAAHGIERDRLEIGYTSPPWDSFRSMDIGLDCFPHNSGTTLYETLYMGIPFITLADRPSVGRLGSTILEGLGHPEWIARDELEYIDITTRLTENLDQLAILRTSLRSEMEKSLLMDEKDFADKVEKAYRQMFLQWCEENS